jgi:hypothetical protein
MEMRYVWKDQWEHQFARRELGPQKAREPTCSPRKAVYLQDELTGAGANALRAIAPPLAGLKNCSVGPGSNRSKTRAGSESS